MADQGNGNQGQEPGAGNQGQGQEPASQGQQGGQGQGQEPGAGSQGQQGDGLADISTMSEAELRTYAAKVQKDAQEARQEAGRYRTAAQQAEQERQERERAEMTETQRLQADLEARTTENQTLAAQVRDLTVGQAARDALGSAGAINPGTALKVMGSDKVKTDEQGNIVAASLAEAITELKKSDPYLFRRTASADAGAGAGQGGAPETGSSINDMIRGRR